MLLGSYTLTFLKEEREHFLKLYKSKIFAATTDSPNSAEVTLLEMATQIDPSAASFSLQIKFVSEKAYNEFSSLDFPKVIEILDKEFPQRYAYFHTLLKYV